MLPHQGEELHRGHLEGDGDVLIGVHHDEVVGPLHSVQIGPAVVGGDLHLLGQVEAGAGQVHDLLIDLHPLKGEVGEVLEALGGVGAGTQAQDQHPGRVVLPDPRQQRRRQGVVVVHPRQAAGLHLDGLDAEHDVGGEDHGVLGLLDLEVVVDGLVLGHVPGLPEGEGGGVAEGAAEQKGHHRRGALGRADTGAEEIHQAQRQHDAGEEQKGRCGAHGGDGDKGGQEGAQNAADGVEGLHGAHGLAAVIQAVHRVAHQGGGHRAQKQQREHEQHQARGKGRPDQEILGDEQCQAHGDAGDDILAHQGDAGDPHRRHQQPPVEPVRVGVLVRRPAAPEVAQGHGDHDGADDDGPDDLAGAEIGGQQPAGAQLHRHQRHAGEKLRYI